MNSIDKQYQSILQDILDNGVKKSDRTGTGTISVFGRQIRHKMSEGFPLLTTKKMYFKGVVTELLWFLRGDTNISYLLDNDCHIWDGDAYKFYLKNFVPPECPPAVDVHPDYYSPMSKEDFIKYMKLSKTDGKRGEEYIKKHGNLGPIYGAQWRNWRKTIGIGYSGGIAMDGTRTNNEPQVAYDSIDQIANLIKNLKENPDSRRLIVSAWNVGELDQMALPPCHNFFQVYTRELNENERMKLSGYEDVGGIGQNIIRETVDEDNSIPRRAISLMWNQRSVDTFLGLPFNIASYALLLEIIAKEVNMVPDELIGNLGDTHLYSNHIEQAKEQITKVPYELPKLKINTEFWQTESGECGVGPLATNLQGFEINDFKLENYQSHPAIKADLSN
jgi:thymidylate synthase